MELEKLFSELIVCAQSEEQSFFAVYWMSSQIYTLIGKEKKNLLLGLSSNAEQGIKDLFEIGP